jgi:hypothetical protein
MGFVYRMYPRPISESNYHSYFGILRRKGKLSGGLKWNGNMPNARISVQDVYEWFVGLSILTRDLRSDALNVERRAGSARYSCMCFE